MLPFVPSVKRKVVHVIQKNPNVVIQIFIHKIKNLSLFFLSCTYVSSVSYLIYMQ
jgi:hypothetical protein